MTLEALNQQYTILIFDSGIGGFSIYKNIKIFFPNARYIYIFDNEFFPYGEQTERFIISRSIKILTVVSKKFKIHIAIIACNTISIAGLPILKERFHFQIIGVLPEIESAIMLTKNKIIGLLATPFTVNHSYIKNMISILSNTYEIKIIGSSELVKITEKKMSGKLCCMKEIKKILEPWLYLNNIPDTILLGCTHFYWIKKELKLILPNNTILINSGNLIPYYISQFITNKKHKQIKKNKVLCSQINDKVHLLSFFFKKNGFNPPEKLILN